MSIEGKFLGKLVSYPKVYDPDLLVAVPRELNRGLYEILDKNLPFVGADAWHAYEVSFLTDTGLPVVGLLKLVYACDNPFLVESKSLKLYLNSFNMERLGETRSEAIQKFEASVKHDLEACLKTTVHLHVIEKDETSEFDFAGFDLLEDEVTAQEIQFSETKEAPSLLRMAGSGTLKVASHLLRSNCKITHQPDWGSVYIEMQGERIPSKESLLQYIVSFRDEYHFHEEVCEMIYKRLWDIFQPEKLMVACLYTRRGGIDICPVRASHQNLLPANLLNAETLSPCLLRQ